MPKFGNGQHKGLGLLLDINEERFVTELGLVNSNHILLMKVARLSLYFAERRFVTFLIPFKIRRLKRLNVGGCFIQPN